MPHVYAGRRGESWNYHWSCINTAAVLLPLSLPKKVPLPAAGRGPISLRSNFELSDPDRVARRCMCQDPRQIRAEIIKSAQSPGPTSAPFATDSRRNRQGQTGA
jgi:hypothetical protein